MSAVPQIAQHPASVDAYIRAGWSLVPIPAGTKGPRTPGWNLKANALKSQADLPQGFGIGLAHAYSQTCAVDIDDWVTTVGVLALQGIDLQALYDANDAVIVDSGRAGHGKLLYALITPLPSKRIVIGGQVAYELRCATSNGSTTQDILPPSTHPITQQPYRWAGKGHWTRLPQLPESLLKLWQSLLAEPVLPSAIPGVQTPDWDEIESAVQSIPSDCSRDEWISVGFALHFASTQISNLEQGLYLWDEWSKTAQSKYPGEREILTQWHSFKHDKATSVKLGTLFKIAKQYGWTKPPIDVTNMFSSVGEIVAPSTVIADIRPVPPKMDFSLWPEVLSRRALELGDTIGCDPLVPLFAGLAATCGAIDAQSRLELLPGFQVPPILWLFTIGEPADKKSPGSAPMFTTLKAIEKEADPSFAKDLLEWEGKEAAHVSAKKAFLEYRSDASAMLNTVAPVVPDLPPQPSPLRLTVEDITSQKLVRMCADRPRGVLCVQDEMSSWVRKVTDKSSGEDRACWTKSYESASYTMDRVGAGSIKADNMAVSFYGNIQPAVFQEHIKDLAMDGLIQRFIPCVLNGDMTRKPKHIPEFLQNTEVWDQTLRIIYSMPALTYTLSPEAFKIYDNFQDWYLMQRNDERLLQSGNTFMTAFGKLEGLAGRLSLMFHVIESPFSTQVSADVMTRVCELVRTYIVPALRYALDTADTDSFQRWFTDYIIQHADQTTMTLKDLKHAIRNKLLKLGTWELDQVIYNAMYSLEESRWTMRVDDGSEESKHIAVWAINPALAQMHKVHRKDVIVAKQRQRNHIYRISSKPVPPVYGYTPDMGK
jgi:hypothetical protein